MILNIEEIAPFDCGEPVKGMQPAIFDVSPEGQRIGSEFCPCLVDIEAGVAVVPVFYRLPMTEAFRAAIKLGRKLKKH